MEPAPREDCSVRGGSRRIVGYVRPHRGRGRGVDWGAPDVPASAFRVLCAFQR